MNAKIIITMDSNWIDFMVKKGNLSAQELKESLEEGFAEEFEGNLMFEKVEVEVTE